MKIKISTDRQPFVNGARAKEGEEFEVTDIEGKAMIANGFAVRADETPKRARNAKGQLKKDNPATPDYNEAWEGGVAPKKKAKKKNAK